MKVFIAGASGVLGMQLMPLLLQRGHSVIGTSRTQTGKNQITSAVANALLLDGLDRLAVQQAILAAEPDVVVHQMTALAGVQKYRNFDKAFAATNRLRTEGTENMLVAARIAGVEAFIAQSYAGWPNARTGSRIKTERDYLDPHPPTTMVRSHRTICRLEQMVSDAVELRGVVLRYGTFYGPGTAICRGGEIARLVEKRQLPIVGSGAGVWSFIQIEDAAEATRIAIEAGFPGIYNIVDDDPAEVSTWLPLLAAFIGANSPHRVPRWFGRLVAGESGVSIMTQIRGCSNAKAKEVLRWYPHSASWREGFQREFRS